MEQHQATHQQILPQQQFQAIAEELRRVAALVNDRDQKIKQLETTLANMHASQYKNKWYNWLLDPIGKNCCHILLQFLFHYAIPLPLRFQSSIYFRLILTIVLMILVELIFVALKSRRQKRLHAD